MKEEIPCLIPGAIKHPEVMAPTSRKLEFFTEGAGIRCRSSTDDGCCLYPPTLDEPPTSNAQTPKGSVPGPVHSNLLTVTASIPTTGISRTPIQVTFTFTNKTESVLPLGLSIGNNNNFMFSGNKQVRQQLFILEQTERLLKEGCLVIFHPLDRLI
jgi:hypothetical protein